MLDAVFVGLRKVKRLIGLGVLILIPIAAVTLVWVALVGDGELHVRLPPDRKLEVVIDGAVATGERLEGDYFRFPLAQGTHQLTVRDLARGSEHLLTVEVTSGGDIQMIPIDGKDCYVVVDPTEAVYAPEGEVPNVAPPRIVSRHGANAAFSPPLNVYRSLERLPKDLREGSRVAYLVPLACDTLTLGDTELGFVALAGSVEALLEGFQNSDAKAAE